MPAKVGTRKISTVFDVKKTCSLATALSFLLVVVMLVWQGKSGRIYGTGLVEISVDSPEQAYTVWEEKGVKGRILLLFGSYPHFTRTIDYKDMRQLTPSNFIEFSAFSNMIRKVYYIVADENWEALRQQGMVGAFRTAPGLERGLYLFTLVGIPVIATTPTSLPDISDTALIFIDGRLFDESSVRSLLAEKGIRSDIVISYRGR
jgi:hypothetical protein